MADNEKEKKRDILYRQLNFMLKSRKALSPIFATLIILAVVTVLFIPVFIWVTGITTQNQASWDESELIATERIVIEEVNLRSGASTCTIYVRNVGKTAVSINSVLIYLSDGTGTTHVYSRTDAPLTFTASPNSVVQGDLITISFSALGFVPGSDEAYTIKISTTRGVGDEYQVVT